jgi:transposase, IS30 family
MSYSHFSSLERFTLYQLRTTEQLSMGIIAKRMKRSKSSISRELKRNRIHETLYLPDTAHNKMQTRRQASKHPFMSVSDSTVNEVKQRLALYHSPEQISGRLEYEGLESISHEIIYQMVYANHQGLGEYQRYLRQGQKKRRRRKGLYQKRGTIPGRVGIEDRPPIADDKDSNRSLGKRYRRSCSRSVGLKLNATTEFKAINE